jgi:hypothetical protein
VIADLKVRKREKPYAARKDSGEEGRREGALERVGVGEKRAEVIDGADKVVEVGAAELLDLARSRNVARQSPRFRPPSPAARHGAR